MARFGGSAALKLDFGVMTSTRACRRSLGAGATFGDAVRARCAGRINTSVLEHRRRQAQIKARRLLSLMEEAQ